MVKKSISKGRKSISKKGGNGGGREVNEDVAEEVAQKITVIKTRMERPHLTLRFRQVDWEFHDFYLTIPRDTSIYQLQLEIAKYQHGDAVFPNDILLYKPISSNPSTTTSNSSGSSSRDVTYKSSLSSASETSLKRSMLKSKMFQPGGAHEGPDEESYSIGESKNSLHEKQLATSTATGGGAGSTFSASTGIASSAHIRKEISSSSTTSNRPILGPVCTNPLMNICDFIGDLDPFENTIMVPQSTVISSASNSSKQLPPPLLSDHHSIDYGATGESIENEGDESDIPEGGTTKALIPMHIWKNQFEPGKPPPTIQLPVVHYAYEFKRDKESSMLHQQQKSFSSLPPSAAGFGGSNPSNSPSMIAKSSLTTRNITNRSSSEYSKQFDSASRLTDVATTAVGDNGINGGKRGTSLLAMGGNVVSSYSRSMRRFTLVHSAVNGMKKGGGGGGNYSLGDGEPTAILIYYDVKTYSLSLPMSTTLSSASNGRRRFQAASTNSQPNEEDGDVHVANLFDRSCALLSFF